MLSWLKWRSHAQYGRQATLDEVCDPMAVNSTQRMLSRFREARRQGHASESVCNTPASSSAVSYTHLTLPTKRIV